MQALSSPPEQLFFMGIASAYIAGTRETGGVGGNYFNRRDNKNAKS